MEQRASGPTLSGAEGPALSGAEGPDVWRRVEGFQRPYVISWNLTYRCNLACEHCYLDAGGSPLVRTENFADRSELGTEECYKVIDEIAAFAPECLTILTGGEPLLRRDILDIVKRAADRGLWVVVGTNGVRISENVAQRLAEAGARGLSLSLDALDPDRHDRFRRVRGAWQNTVDGAEILNRVGLPFIVQTTAGSHNQGELDAIADFAHDHLAAKVWNLYFLVPTGRGQFVSDMTPAQYRRRARVALSDPAEVPRAACSRTRSARRTTSRPFWARSRLASRSAGPPSLKLRRATFARTQREGWREVPRSGTPERKRAGVGPREHQVMRTPSGAFESTPAVPVAARPARTTWGSGRTATSHRARTCRCSPARSATRGSPTCGRRRICSLAFVSARRSAGAAETAR